MKRRKQKRKSRRGGRRRTATALAPSVPLAVVRGAKVLRSIQMYTRIQDTTSWADNLLYYGMYALKLYLADFSPATKEKMPVGSLQSMLVTLDDLLVGSAFVRSGVGNDGPDQYRAQFSKGKLHAMTVKLFSTAAPSHRSGRMGLSFVWFNEAEALEAVGDLKHKQTPVLPDLKRFFQMPGVNVSPVSSSCTRTWVPPVGSWVRDYVRIGKSEGAGSENAWGLPVGRVIVGYQNLDSQKAADSYITEDASLMVEFAAKMDLAELGDRELRKQFAVEYDANSYGVYSASGIYDVPSASLKRVGRFYSPIAPSESSPFTGVRFNGMG